MSTDFEKLIGTRRQEFTITLETDDGPVKMTFTHPKKSIQAITLDCKAADDAIVFLMETASGNTNAPRPKNGEDLDIAGRAAGVYCLLNELVTPPLTPSQRQEMLDKMAPHLLQSLSDQVSVAITKNMADAAKN